MRVLAALLAPTLTLALTADRALAAPASPAPAVRGVATPYRAAAARIIEAAMADDGAWKKLAHLCDRIGARPSGSAALKAAASWASAALAADGHEAVRTEEVKVPHWVRGAEEVTLVCPVMRPLSMIGLGGTVSTPGAGIVGEVLVAPTFAALQALGIA